MTMVIAHFIFMPGKMANKEFFVYYHHLKSFTWLVSLKFVTHESPGRIFKPKNGLPDRIITISALSTSCLNFLQESPRGVFQSRERVPSKLKPSHGAVQPPIGVGKPPNGASTQPPDPALHPAEHSYRWEWIFTLDPFYPFPSQTAPLIECKYWNKSYTIAEEYHQTKLFLISQTLEFNILDQTHKVDQFSFEQHMNITFPAYQYKSRMKPTQPAWTQFKPRLKYSGHQTILFPAHRCLTSLRLNIGWGYLNLNLNINHSCLQHSGPTKQGAIWITALRDMRVNPIPRTIYIFHQSGVSQLCISHVRISYPKIYFAQR